MVYNRAEHSFVLRTAPGGILDNVTLTYSRNGRSVQPKETGLYDVRFTPSDPVNFLPATAQVHIQVGATPAPTHTVRVKTEGAGSVILRSGDLTYPAFGPFYDGMNLTLQAITSEGNRFKGFEIKGVTYATNPYELEVKEDLEATALFGPPPRQSMTEGPNW